MIDVTNPTELRREAERRQQLRARGILTFSEPNKSDDDISSNDNSDSRMIDPIEYELDEKAIEHACDQLAQKAGARVIRFSHPGKTQQTPGSTAFRRWALRSGSK
jgi:SPX domain protein involved in polyphosphate accumulation